jgi:DNA-binding transcriptional ArsR family regulator
MVCQYLGKEILMNPPFDGLFGDTCETRLLAFLLPMYGIEFDMAELVEEIGLTRQSIAKAMKKFSDRGMVKIRKEGRTPLYSINEDSSLVKRLEDFDNSLIEAMVGPEEFDKIRLTHEKHEHRSLQKESGYSTRKAVHRYGESKDKAPCVASRPGTYVKERHLVIQ